MGIPGHDHELPPADVHARRARTPGARPAPPFGGNPPATRPDALDAKLMRAALMHELRLLAERPRFRDPPGIPARRFSA